VRLTVPLPLVLAGLVVPLAVLAPGCASRPADRPVPPSADQNLRFLGQVYQQASSRNGHAPQSADELRPALRRFGYSEAMLVSPNDKQPYTIRWGVNVFQPGPKGALPVLAYESTGVDGKKYVINCMLTVKQMTEPELAEALQAD
jgi:hypothetical protein